MINPQTVVDSFGANEQHELFGGKHGEETLTLRNDQTIALCWTKKGLDLYDDDKENDIEVHPSARYLKHFLVAVDRLSCFDNKAHSFFQAW